MNYAIQRNRIALPFNNSAIHFTLETAIPVGGERPACFLDTDMFLALGIDLRLLRQVGSCFAAVTPQADNAQIIFTVFTTINESLAVVALPCFSGHYLPAARLTAADAALPDPKANPRRDGGIGGLADPFWYRSRHLLLKLIHLRLDLGSDLGGLLAEQTAGVA